MKSLKAAAGQESPFKVREVNYDEPIASLNIDDEDEVNLLGEKLEQNGVFDTELRRNLSEVSQRAVGKEIISLDVQIDNNSNESYNVAQDLLNDDYSRPVYTFTSYPDSVRSKPPIPWMFYCIEKNKKTFDQADYIQSSILTVHKCLYLASIITQNVSNKTDSLEEQSLLRNLTNELVNLHRRSLFFSKTLPKKQAIEFRELNHLLPGECVEPQAFSNSTLEIQELPEKLLNFSVKQNERLRKISGVYELESYKKAMEAISGRVSELKGSNNTSKSTERRYVETEFPETCKIGEVVELKICVRKEGERNPLAVPFSNEDDKVELLIKIAGDGFEIPPDLFPLIVPRTDDSDALVTPIKPRKGGTQYLFITFFKDVREIGSVILRTVVEK